MVGIEIDGSEIRLCSQIWIISGIRLRFAEFEEELCSVAVSWGDLNESPQRRNRLLRLSSRLV